VLPDDRVVIRMQALTQRWTQDRDARAVFLGCYQLMTSNTLAAIRQREFRDAVWVDGLLHRFADYYFGALEAYERDPAAAPPIWQMTFGAAGDRRVLPVQHLLLGVNAHINYDLVLALADRLRAEWSGLSAEQRAGRYADHCHVNAVIARTIDSVQDRILDPAMPAMKLIDVLLGRLDERMVSAVISRWRETVWRNAQDLLAAPTGDEQQEVLRGVEAEALRLGHLIGQHG